MSTAFYISPPAIDGRSSRPTRAPAKRSGPGGSTKDARAIGVRKNSRGTSYWTDGKESRILTITPGYQLVSLDAKTGQPDVSFGRDGIVDMTREVEKDANFDPTIGHLMNTSPPLIFGNVALIPTRSKTRAIRNR